ncbi:MAG: hypothetical protein Q9219_007037 [cf. Caloplaca sp. 3 TL-2023]
MDSPGERPVPYSVADEKGNPLVSFSRLVDQQVTSLFRTFSELSSSFVRSRSVPDSATFDTQGHRRSYAETQDQVDAQLIEKYPFCSHSRETAEEIEWPAPRIEGKLHLWPRQDKNHDEHGEQLDRRRKDVYAENLWDRIYCSLLEDAHQQDEKGYEEKPDYLKAETVLPARSQSLLPFTDLSVTKFLENTLYPPLQFEHQSPFCEHNTGWEQASKNLSMTSYENDFSEAHEAPIRTRNWAISLVKPGLVGWGSSDEDLFPVDQPKRHGTRQRNHDVAEDVVAELDVYRSFTSSQPLWPLAIICNQTLDSSNPGQMASQETSLISTLTTTRCRTLPDGSVFTQRVLKQRFSDGREESTEIEHAVQGAQNPIIEKQIPQQVMGAGSISTPALGHDGRILQALSQENEGKQKRSGWFWS